MNEVINEEDIPEEYAEEAKQVMKLCAKFNETMGKYPVSVVVSSLMTCLVQALCASRSSKQEATEHIFSIGNFLLSAMDHADKEGICAWNSTLQ